MHFAVAVGGIHGGGNGAHHRSRMKGDAELPAIGKVDANHLSRPDAGGNQPVSGALDQVSVFRVADAARWCAGGVDDGDLVAVLPAGVEYHIVDEFALRIVVKPRAK